MSLRILVSTILLLLLGGVASAQQYQVHSWESFEEGQLSDRVIRGHFADESTVQVKPVTGVGLPQQVLTASARLELGNGLLEFAPTSERPHLSIFTPVSLDRRNLGTRGSALYQADFYFPPAGEPMPSVAMLAQVLDGEGKTTYRFYRFGYEEGKNRVFFAFLNNTAQPEVFLFQSVDELNLRRPGWHRFQIIFHGQSEIYCAIDGQFTSFSPITEGTHSQLNAGLMVTSQNFDARALVDNLSIQWTTGESPLPLSPWTSIALTDANPNTTPLESGSSVAWLNDPNEAWSRASAQKRPLLVMFYVPGIVPYESLKTRIPNDAETHNLFNRYVLLRIDANQLMGGRLAEKFGVIRLPTFIVMNASGQEERRHIVTPQATWPEIKQAIFAE